MDIRSRSRRGPKDHALSFGSPTQLPIKINRKCFKKKKTKNKKPLMPGLLLWYVCSVGRRWELELGILKNISGDFSV